MRGFATLQPFIRNVIMPYVVSLRDLIRGESTYLQGQHQAHTERTDNPHQVNLAQLGTISTAAPQPHQGRDGDVWFQILE